jgi:hypothetical protein
VEARATGALKALQTNLRLATLAAQDMKNRAEIALRRQPTSAR